MATLRDLAGNPVPSGTTGQVLGFLEPPAPEEILTLSMYEFLIKPIRDMDRLEGALFVKRFLDGAQAIWLQTQEKIFSIKDLWSLTECPDEYLQYLKNIVGWTVHLNHITDGLDSDTLRRLIGASVPLWKTRGPEETIIEALGLLTTARARYWNWFDFRWVLDETQLGEEHEGRDPWIIDLPGPPNYDEMRFNVRIVDDGSLNRTLVNDVLKLMRPVGERIEVNYLTFLDRFNTPGDDYQWEWLSGSGTIQVGDGRVTLNASGLEFIGVNLDQASTWESYSFYSRVRSTIGGASVWGFGSAFMIQDASNYYLALLNQGYNDLYLYKVVAGTPSLLATFDFSTIFETLQVDQWYGLRVVAIQEGANLRIRIYIDGTLRIEHLDASPFLQGTIGLMHSSGWDLECDEVEMFEVPMDTDFIDINS